MTLPLVSIIIPAYNRGELIANTLDALIQQDYENIEIIVVDDASADNTAEITEKILSAGGRNFQVIRRKKNGAMAAARNTGLDASHGEYVWFCDSDDLPDKDFVSIMLNRALKDDVDAVFCGFRNYYADKNVFADEPIPFQDGILSSEYCLSMWARRKFVFWSVWSFLFSKTFLVKNGLRFTERCYFGEDTEFIMKALACCPRVSFISRQAYTYIHHNQERWTHWTAEQSSIRNKQNLYLQLRLTTLRVGRYIARRTKSKLVRRYALNFYIPDAIIKQFKVYAKAGDRKSYDRFRRILKHRKTRELLLSTVKMIFTMPEVFFKAVMVLYAPNLYYALRRGKK